MGFFSDIVKPFKELGQEILKPATTIASGGLARYDEDKGFKEGFVTKTAIRESTKVVGNVIDLATKNPLLTDAVGASFGIPNASTFLSRKEESLPANPNPEPQVILQSPPAFSNNNNTMMIVAVAAIGFILVLFISKKR